MLEKAILKRADRFMFTEHNSGNGYLNGKMMLEETCFHINDPSVYLVMGTNCYNSFHVGYKD